MILNSKAFGSHYIHISYANLCVVSFCEAAVMVQWLFCPDYCFGWWISQGDAYLVVIGSLEATMFKYVLKPLPRYILYADETVPKFYTILYHYPLVKILDANIDRTFNQ